MDEYILLALLVGVTSGWVVSQFSPEWSLFANQVSELINPKYRIMRNFVKQIMNLIGFVLLLLIIIIISLLV